MHIRPGDLDRILDVFGAGQWWEPVNPRFEDDGATLVFEHRLADQIVEVRVDVAAITAYRCHR